MSDLNPRETALKKINDALAAGKAAAEARVAELEAELAKAQRGSRFGRRRAAEPPPVLLPPHEPAPEPAPKPRAEPVTFEGRPTLPQLQALAAQSGADELAVYVDLLREHAWVDGTIPPQFDDILRDVFGASF